ncbi:MULTISPECIES: hypothetical protein [unclassified Carboxydocella]|uniref:hypothetical protein n=1 Tax=unclassified Carboxydocella TaxID=2685367 RepID=UPI0009AD476F|nr:MULTISPECIES: hypothetical protein [unclassified Carboxydocella]GAW29744.1 phosphoglucomutase/phosphomannomutase alpha/beta/alpha domain I [Carboxydocella sp. ULO1]GAW32430.1 phosphoglucomutase/phosphomannomutase alpha/beta/alpha domain I [Carboxydocella sp. JDF658]
MSIRFGTDGWRGEIGIDFILANVHQAIIAVGNFFFQKYRQGVLLLIGYDTRFQAQRFAHYCAEQLSWLGHRVLLANKPITTPVLSHAIRHLQAAGGIMLTASHNPPQWLGIKIKNEYGSSAPASDTAWIETLIGKETKPFAKGCWQIKDFDEVYLQAIHNRVGAVFMNQPGQKVIVDCLYGSGQGYFPRLLANYGWQVKEIHAEINPAFGGLNPEPIAANLRDLQKAVLQQQTVGLALDGDGDRLGVVIESGEIITAQDIFLLLLYHLVENKQKCGKVIKTFSTTAKVDLLARLYNLELIVTPIGFKHIAPLLIQEEKVVIGGEESGGFGFPDFLPERDGIFSGLNLLELQLISRESLPNLLNQLKQKLGPWHYQRLDLVCSPEQLECWHHKLNTIPAKIGEKIKRQEKMDGIKVHFSSGAWLLFRFSGTEPVLRLYCEGENPAEVDYLLSAAQDWLND